MHIWKMRPKLAASAMVFAFAALLITTSCPVGAATNLLSGQKQYYTVMMRSDKQSLVYAKVTFENPSTKDALKTFSFTLPDDVAVSNLSVQQILAKQTTKTCKTYETYNEYKNRVSSVYEQTQTYYDQNKRCITYDETSAYDEDFDFDANMSSSTDYYYYEYYLRRSTDSKFEYTDLTAKRSGQTYTVELPTPLQPKKQGAVLVAYTSKDYISGSVGRYHYDFRTFTAKELVSKAVVAVNFDDDLYSTLTSSKRQVSTSAAGSLTQGTSLTADSAYESKSVDDIQTSVGRGGRYVKEKAQLLPGETFSVKGVFATNKFMLYLPGIVWGVVVLLLLAAGTWFGYRLYRRKHPKTDKPHPVPSVQATPTQAEKTSAPVVTVKSALFTSLAATGASGALLLIIAGLVAVLDFDSYSSTFISFVVLLTALLTLTVLFALPFVYVLKEHGLKGVYRWLICHVAVLFVILIAACCVYALTSQPDTYDSGGVVPMIDTTQ